MSDIEVKVRNANMILPENPSRLRNLFLFTNRFVHRDLKDSMNSSSLYGYVSSAIEAFHYLHRCIT